MRRLILLAVIFASCATVYAADPTKPSKCVAAGYLGTDAVFVSDERSEYASARGSAACAIARRLDVWGRTHVSGTQDGGGIAAGNYESFRAVEVALGGRYRAFGPVRVGLFAGTTVSIEGTKDAPVRARNHTAGVTVGFGFGDLGYVEAIGAYDQRVGGFGGGAAVSIPLKGNAYTTLDYAVPVERGPDGRRAQQFRIGAHLRVKKFLF